MEWSLKGEFFYLCTNSLSLSLSVWRICFLILGLNWLFAMELEKLLVNDNIGTSCQTDVSHALYQTLQRTKWALKIVRLTSFQEAQLKSVSIFFKLVHPCLFLYLLCYLYFLFTFWAVIFMFHSVWWRFPLVEFWKKIPWHCSLKSASIPLFVLADTFPLAFTSLVRLSPYSSLRHRWN